MKYLLRLIVIVFAATIIASCANNQTDNMPREDALKMLDDKIKKSDNDMSIPLKRTDDILKWVS